MQAGPLLFAARISCQYPSGLATIKPFSRDRPSHVTWHANAKEREHASHCLQAQRACLDWEKAFHRVSHVAKGLAIFKFAANRWRLQRPPPTHHFNCLVFINIPATFLIDLEHRVGHDWPQVRRHRLQRRKQRPGRCPALGPGTGRSWVGCGRRKVMNLVVFVWWLNASWWLMIIES